MFFEIFFLKLCSFFKRFLFLQKFSILHSHLLSFQMKFNTPYVLPNFGIQSIIFQNLSGIFKTSLLVTSKIYSIQNFCSNFIILFKVGYIFQFFLLLHFIISFTFLKKALYVFICWNVTSILF